MLESILSTKLYIPKMRDKNVMRKTLVEKIASGIERSNKVTLVSAPAGYGKTTLVLELIDYMSVKSAWISLDEGDNDLTRFLSYIIAALKGVGVGIESDTERLLIDLSLSSNQAITTMIINDIAASLDKVILVLDDFHLISSTQVYDAVKFLIEHQPSNFHIILITREDPRISLSRLRALGQLTEIRVDDLRFNRDEAEEFLKITMGLNIGSEIIETFNSKTEGWIAGLQLAGLSLRGSDEKEIGDFAYEFNGTHRYIIDYLVDEVLQLQEEEIRNFLCRTSVLQRMNGELCDALVEVRGSRAILHRLEQENLFVIPLDEKREWYRYHHLFQDSLRAELSKVEEQLLHKRAASWLEENGYKQEAVKHGFESGDMNMTLRLIVDNTEQMFASAELHTLVKWIDALPDELVMNSEILSVRKAWALFITGNINEAVEYLNSLGEDFLEKTTPHNRGLALSLRATISQLTGQGKVEELAKEALGLLEAWDPISRISTLNTLGRAQESSGKTNEAGETFKIAYFEGQKLGYTFITTLALKNLGTSLNNLGKKKEAIELYLKYIDGMALKLGKPLPFIGIIYSSLAELYYEENDLEKANSYISMGIELCKSISYYWIQSSEILASRIKYALEEKNTAIKATEKTIDTSLESSEYIEKLSQREIDILKLLGKGLTNNEISNQLYISTNTTQWHISHIYSKLNVKNRTQAILKAKKLGIM